MRPWRALVGCRASNVKLRCKRWPANNPVARELAPVGPRSGPIISGPITTAAQPNGSKLPRHSSVSASQKRLMHLLQRFKVIRRCFGAQLFVAAKTITHRRRIKPVAARADQVVFAVSDHQGVGRVEAFFGD